MFDKMIAIAALVAGTTALGAAALINDRSAVDGAAFVVAKNGADDGAKADDRGRGGHGRDDGANHG